MAKSMGLHTSNLAEDASATSVVRSAQELECEDDQETLAEHSEPQAARTQQEEIDDKAASRYVLVESRHAKVGHFMRRNVGANSHLLYLGGDSDFHHPFNETGVRHYTFVANTEEQTQPQLHAQILQNFPNAKIDTQKLDNTTTIHRFHPDGLALGTDPDGEYSVTYHNKNYKDFLAQNNTQYDVLYDKDSWLQEAGVSQKHLNPHLKMGGHWISGHLSHEDKQLDPSFQDITPLADEETNALGNPNLPLSLHQHGGNHPGTKIVRKVAETAPEAGHQDEEFTAAIRGLLPHQQQGHDITDYITEAIERCNPISPTDLAAANLLLVQAGLPAAKP